MNLSSANVPRLSDWLGQVRVASERDDPLWQAIQALASTLPVELVEKETISLLESLLALEVSPEVLLAAALANWPALHAAINPKQDGLSRLQPLPREFRRAAAPIVGIDTRFARRPDFVSDAIAALAPGIPIFRS